MGDPIDLAAARFARARDCSDVTVRDVLVETLREIDAGEVVAENIIIIMHIDGEHSDPLLLTHGGPGGINERLGLLARATAIMLRVFE